MKKKHLRDHICIQESEIASSCLLLAGEDYHQCDPQVENYKTCKRFWVNPNNL